MSKNRAIFLDRDGTIIEDRGHLQSIEDIHLYDNTIPSLLKVQDRFMLFIVTHQPGVSRGLISKNDVKVVNDYIRKILLEHSIDILEIYVCPHDRTEGCGCIKPLPYFLFQASEKYDIDLTQSFVIGDHPHDVELAVNAGATGIYVMTGHGENHKDEMSGDNIVVKNIAEAVDFIIGDNTSISSK